MGHAHAGGQGHAAADLAEHQGAFNQAPGRGDGQALPLQMPIPPCRFLSSKHLITLPSYFPVKAGCWRTNGLPSDAKQTLLTAAIRSYSPQLPSTAREVGGGARATLHPRLPSTWGPSMTPPFGSQIPSTQAHAAHALTGRWGGRFQPSLPPQPPSSPQNPSSPQLLTPKTPRPTCWYHRVGCRQVCRTWLVPSWVLWLKGMARDTSVRVSAGTELISLPVAAALH